MNSNLLRDEAGTLLLKVGGAFTRVEITDERTVRVVEAGTEVDLDAVRVLVALGGEAPQWWPFVRCAEHYLRILPRMGLDYLRPLALGTVNDRIAICHGNPDMAAIFALDPAPKVRDFVARNTSDLTVLDRLVKDSSNMVRHHAGPRRMRMRALAGLEAAPEHPYWLI